ncbi:MAG: sugar transferase [Lachnospiraceae bacterium]|nr:sugar transferase [Lachnospiraceae bacterium]
MAIDKKKVKTLIGIGGVALGAAFVGMEALAKKKKRNSVYDNEPEQKNPLEGKKVVFVEDENDPENADGARGHLEAVGDSDYKPGFYGKYGKRAMDIVLSFGGLVLLSPIYAGIALAIKIDDPGPVLFTQKRMGQNKQYFKLHKFRSMKMSTPHDVPTHMLDNPDQYITKVGKFLRAHSLDELPQIWDIFIGNMSVIGPRPGLWNQDILTAERDKYGANDVKPGLTGWAQINGRDELEIPDKAKLDGDYVQNMGLKMDAKCFLGSVHVFGKDESVVEGGTGEMKKTGGKYTEGKTAQELIGHIGFGEPVEIDSEAKKKVLITGADSYIGEMFQSYAMEHYADNFEIDTLDMLDPEWDKTDFSGYDIVYHVAGIAHADVGNVSEETKAKYYAVNTDLTVKVAEKAKNEGVKEFIFMSSMIVYGESAPYGTEKIVDEYTVPNPANFYGDSKLQADMAVRDLADDSFKVLVLRPPMIYGKGSKGNYPTLAKLAKKLPVFPDVDNARSMLHIDNLCEFLCQIMLVKEMSENAVVLFPQNKEWTKTADMVHEIAKVSGKNVKLLKVMNPCVAVGKKVPGKVSGLVNKAFGNNCYAHKMSVYPGIEYQRYSLKESIIRTEGNTREASSDKEDHIEMNKKPRALMLASVASMIDLFNMDNIKILLDLGYEVDVMANFKFGSITSQERVDAFKQELLDMGIHVYHVPIPRSLSMIKEMATSYQNIKKLVEEKQYQIVHCHSPIGGVLCRLACQDARKKFATKVIYTAHGFHFYKGAGKKAWAVFYPIEKWCSNYTDILITINQEDYQNAKTFHAEKVEYVPGIGVHTEEFQNVEVNRIEKRKEFGFNPDDFIFMSVGQLSIRKNHEVIIRALAEIDSPSVKYMIVGFGELEEKLRFLVKELGLQDRVIFTGYRSDVKELLHIVDAFAFPSLQEGLPASLMEAMSVGLPVVCSRIRGNVDLIEDGKGGYIFECHDVDGFACGMKKIVNTSDFDMGRFNQEKMRCFNINTVNDYMRQIYTEV